MSFPSERRETTNTTGRAGYAPPALRRFAVNRGEASGVVSPRDIAIERFQQRLDIHKSNVAPSPHRLHRHFVTEARDRRLAVHEAIGDIRDAVTGMDNVADVIFVGFAIRPEWNLSEPLNPADIHVETITSHHLLQHSVYKEVVNDLREVVQERIVFPHIYTYHQRLHSVTPGCGYVVDTETGRIRDNAVRLAQGVAPPPSIDQHPRVAATSTHITQTPSTPLPVVSRIQDCRGASPIAEPSSFHSPREAPAAVTSDVVPIQLPSGRVRWVRQTSRTTSGRDSPLARSTRGSPANEPNILPPSRSNSMRPGSNGNITSSRPATVSPAVPTAADHTPRPTAFVRRTGTTAAGIASSSTIPAATQIPIVVSDSDSDSDSSGDDLASYRTVVVAAPSDDDEESESDVESWVHTPEGSPPRRSSRNPAVHPTVSGSSDLDDPPPEYSAYLQPTVESFGFHPTIAEFLRARNLSPAGLVRIDSTLDYHVNDWAVGFLGAGLSSADAQQLRKVVIQSLPDAVREALITAWIAEEE